MVVRSRKSTPQEKMLTEGRLLPHESSPPAMDALTAEMTRRFSVGGVFRLARTRTGVLALTTGGNIVVRTASSVVLTRLLTPSDFGMVGIISSIFVAVNMIT